MIETVSGRKMATTTRTRILDAAVWSVRRHERDAARGSVVVVRVVVGPATLVLVVALVPVVVALVPVVVALVPVSVPVPTFVVAVFPVVFVIAAVVFILAVVVLIIVVLVEVGTRQRNGDWRCLRREWDRRRDYRH
jgi:hypothetical protein